MKWYFQPPTDGGGAERDDDDDSAPGLLDLPAALLERHGARILDPGRAAMVDGYPRPQATVYRAMTLLVPDDLQRDVDFIAGVNGVLGLVGMVLVPHGEGRDPDLDSDRADQGVLEALGQLPRPANLVPLPGYRRPVDIDAWTALQALRAATASENPVPGDEASADGERVILDKAQIERIALEHLLIGSPLITGSPADSPGGGGISAGPGSASNGPGITDSYVFDGDSRTPVTVLIEPPPRGSADECASRYGRRPVVAVLDTGVRQHPWLGVTANAAGGYTMTPGGFVAIDPRIQHDIAKESQRAAAQGGMPRQVIADAWDDPIADNPLIGEVNDALGHCTFIAGILRQVVPEATVLAVRVMCSDDILYEGDILCALRHLAKRIALGAPDDLAAQVDVLSLSFGYFSESPSDQMINSGLWNALKLLISLGVIVVAAAGNYASRRRFYPAAFARQPVPAGQVPVVSVGALNVNGTKAMFSNDGDWVVSWAPGAHVVSTYPTDVDGSRTPELRIPVNREPAGHWPPGREALDPDDFSVGFAVWSGTSFSAPYAAALITRSLLEDAERSGAGLKLDAPGIGERRKRAVAAYDNLPRSIG
jgi:hypothetical protein